MFRIDDFVKTFQPKPVETKPVQQPTQPTQPQNTSVATTRQTDAQYFGAANKAKLEKQFAANQITPYKALEQIKNLPPPAPPDKAAVTEYKTQRKQIADDAIKNSQPPKIEDFRNSGLNGATANYEYQQAKQGYDTQIRDLKKISADAAKYPDKILTPYEATQEINALPRPDRSNPQSVAEYNNKRAEIADAALLYAKPPTREDFKSLPGATGNYEYQDALRSYNSTVAQLKKDSSAGGTTALPAMTDAEVNQAADEYIQNHNGVRNEDDAYAVGKDVAALAKTDPEGAAAVMAKIQGKLNGTTYGDNVASGFVDNSSVEDLREFSNKGGEAVLRDLQKRLTTGDVHDGEYQQSEKINEAITGFAPNSLTGDPEKDAKTVDEQLQKLSPEMQEKYVKELLKNPFGQNAVRFAAAMSPEGEKTLGETLGRLYNSNPTETREALRQITDNKNIGIFPVAYQSGLGYIIGQSGNDNLIKDFAQHEIDRAKSDPDNVRGYLNAVTAYSGLSPEALQDVMKNNPDFYTAVDKAGFLIGGEPTSAGFENPNIWEPGLGDLLEKASQIKDANGNATPEAVKLFETAVNHASSNFRTMEGLGAFFVEHADQLIDKYTNPLDPATPGSDVLEKFFGNVVYSRIADTLQYKGGKLVDAIMGDANGNGGVIGGVVDKYLAAANAKPGDGELDRILGQRIGFLWSALSKGFLEGVQNYKDDWMDDKQLRDFTFDMLGRGLGKIASKFKLPGEIIDKPLSLVQGIYDARAEDDKEKQLAMFKTAFNELNNAMFSRLNNYDVSNKNVENVNDGFVDAYNWQFVQELLNKVITD